MAILFLFVSRQKKQSLKDLGKDGVGEGVGMSKFVLWDDYQILN